MMGKERWVVLMSTDDPLTNKDAISAGLTANSVLAWKKQQPFGLATEKSIEFVKCFLGISSI